MDHLEKLRMYRTPVVYDTIERFGLRPRTEGYTDHSIKAIFPGMAPFVGYACTGRIMAEIPEAEGQNKVAWADVWQHVERSRKPSIMVCQDLDQPPAQGCAWGDVAAAIFQRLGCVAAITNGGVRDIREVEKMGFGLFAPAPVVAHAYIRFVEVGGPVKVGNLVVSPGELIHVDEHGAVVIPAELDLATLLRSLDRFLASESSIIEYARTAPQFDIAALQAKMAEHDAAGHFS